jgi:3-O-methylgallate 3,4-dioxygenase
VAEIVLAIGTSHTPILSIPPENWEAGHAAKDRIEYADVFEERARANAGWIEKECNLPRWQEQYAAVQRAIASLADTFARVKPDVAVIVGDDQRELFRDDPTPALAIYWGQSLQVAPPAVPSAPFRALAKWAEYGDEPATYQCVPELAKHMIDVAIDGEFDIANVRKVPAGRQVGHAYNFVCRRIMAGCLVPYVPVWLNAFYGLNQPRAGRCFAFGQMLHEAIESWDSDARVALVASGGLSHTIVDEELDRGIIAALKAKNPHGLTHWDESRFHWPGMDGFGTGETKSWITVAGAVQDTDLKMELVDYLPIYRTVAGSGVGATFARWQ